MRVALENSFSSNQLDEVFNRPPQEPKVAFVLKDLEKSSATRQSVRQRFEQHRNEPACFSCHIRLDPPGFALETFNPIGAAGSGRPTGRTMPAMLDGSGAWRFGARPASASRLSRNTSENE